MLSNVNVIDSLSVSRALLELLQVSWSFYAAKKRKKKRKEKEREMCSSPLLQALKMIKFLHYSAITIDYFSFEPTKIKEIYETQIKPR